MNRRWVAVADDWDNDPAVERLYDAIALQPVQEPPSDEKPAEPVPEPDEVKRSRIAALIARVRSGDRTAIEMLRDLLRESH